MNTARRRWLVLIVCAVLSACTPSAAPLPTVSSFEMAQTAQVQTQNAPPTGFNVVTFPLIDAHLSDQPAWYAALTITFDGVFAADQQKTTGTLNAQIYRNELTTGRRVLFKANGSVFGITDERALEGVRLGNDYYLVAQNVCSQVADTTTRQIADLAAGSLLGGVKSAKPTGQRDTIGGLAAWEYAFAPDAITTPILHLAAKGSATVAAGDLWVAPSVNGVARFTLTVNVQNATLLQGDQVVSGQLREVYELREVGTLYNISIPFGC